MLFKRRRNQMQKDVDHLAKRDRIPHGGNWIARSGDQPSHPKHKQVMGRVK